MAVNPPQDPLARERARKRKAEKIRRRRIVLAVGVLGLIVLIVALAVGLSGDSDGTTSTTNPSGDGETTTTSLEAATFTADLTGANSVPPVGTDSTGTLTMDYDPTTLALTFSLSLAGLSKPSNAAIYEGAAGSSGTVVYVLFAGPTETVTQFDGELANGTVEAGKLTGSLAGMTVGDLIALIKTGNAYVSVGNVSHPVDAIRGPIN